MAIEYGSKNLPRMIDGKNGTSLSGDYFNPIWQRLDGRFHVLEETRASWLDAVDLLTRQGLTRIDTVLAPAFDKLQRVLELGFLMVDSDTSLTLAQDAELTFVTVAGDQSDLFKPSQLLGIQRKSDPATWAIARLAAPYNRSTRELQVTILAVTGPLGPFNDWQIGSMAGMTAASVVLRDQALAARNDAVAAAALVDGVEEDAATATAKAALATTKAAEAAASAALAATFDPGNFYTKSAVDTKVSNEATARADADAALLTAVNARQAMLVSETKAANFTGTVGKFYILSGTITATFPANPAENDNIAFLHEGAETTPYTLNFNGKTFEGNGSITVGVPFPVRFVYTQAAWRLAP
ncbi:MAG: hypothetical protein DI604_26885 [Delftia acidovorans]|nr:MAG: hypothetical protein DI604_26885 [Delftia acidovorans]